MPFPNYQSWFRLKTSGWVRAAMIVFSLLASAGAGELPSMEASKASKDLFPSTFASIDDATQWARRQFAGGRVDEVTADSGRHLVVFLHGSGVPVVRIGLYRRKSSQWQFVSQQRPPDDSGEFLRASVTDGKIVLVGEKSGRTWPLSASD